MRHVLRALATALTGKWLLQSEAVRGGALIVFELPHNTGNWECAADFLYNSGIGFCAAYDRLFAGKNYWSVDLVTHGDEAAVQLECALRSAPWPSVRAPRLLVFPTCPKSPLPFLLRQRQHGVFISRSRRHKVIYAGLLESKVSPSVSEPDASPSRTRPRRLGLSAPAIALPPLAVGLAVVSYMALRAAQATWRLVRGLAGELL